ncbi:unnamed protein product, partial [Brassica oleracea var. botrytis]
AKGEISLDRWFCWTIRRRLRRWLSSRNGHSDLPICLFPLLGGIVASSISGESKSSITGVETWTRIGESGEADKTIREWSIVSRVFVLSCSCFVFGHGTCTLALFWSRVFVARLLSFGHENALICIWSQVFVRLIKC